LNIFIYGNNDFKKDIRKILKDSNLNEKLEDSLIEEITDVEILKQKISSNPDDVYLIDDEKIIKKSRFKFLKQKDGIEEEFLRNSGISDISLDSFEELPSYILKKYEQQNTIKPEQILDDEIDDENLVLDSELAELLENKKEKSGADSSLIRQIIEDANPKDEKVEEDNTQRVQINEPVGLDIKELDGLISNQEDSEEGLKIDDFSMMEDFQEDVGLHNIALDYDEGPVDYENDPLFSDSTKSDADILASLLEDGISDDEDFEANVETFEDVNFLEEIFPNRPNLVSSYEIEKKPKKPQIKEKEIGLDELIQGDFNFVEDIKQGDSREDLNKDISESLNENINKIEQDVNIGGNEPIIEKEEQIEENSIEDDKLEEVKSLNKQTIEEEAKSLLINENSDTIKDENNLVQKDEISQEESSTISQSIKQNEEQGEVMSDEFLELDSLNEQDLLEALGESGNIKTPVESQGKNTITNNNQQVELNGANADDIATLISTLLSNKTLEITIKVKD